MNNQHIASKTMTTDDPLFTEEQMNEFRVAIFGSARTKKDDPLYKEVYDVAKAIGEREIDVVTGGGPGVMEAANQGHEDGSSKSSESIGLTIELPFEAEGNEHLNIKKHFIKFSNRLEQFMRLSNVIVVMPGGIGTCLELFFTWQLIQVKHVCPMPIILYGDMWETLIEWIKDYPLAQNRMNPEDLDMIYVAKSPQEIIDIVDQAHEGFKKAGPEACLNISFQKNS